MRYFILLSAFFVLHSFPSKACECNYQGSFVEMVKDKYQSNLVALVKVEKYLSFKDIYGKPMPMSMEAEVIEIFKGIEHRKTIKVWGDPGNLCRPYLNRFSEKNYYVIAMMVTGKEKEDYTISVCGAFWLNYNWETKTVSGDINTKNQGTVSMSLNNFKGELKKELEIPTQIPAHGN